MDLSASVLLLFIVAALVALAARRLRVPYTVALVAAGLALGATNAVAPPVLTKQLLFTVFLPGLLFEAAFRLELEDFWRNRLTVFSLAVPGVVLATLLTTAALVPALRLAGAGDEIGWGAALVFATLITATDPIAVVALVRKLGAPYRLGLVIEGESLLNDGTAAVFFTLAVSFVLGTGPSTASLVVDFFYMIGGGIIIGGVIGLTVSQVIGRLDDPMLEITVTTITAYGSFMAGEGLQASGVIATVVAGLLCGNRHSQRQMSPSSRLAVATFWEYVAFALNSLVFLLIGFQVRIPALLSAWRPILFTYIIVTGGRAIVTYGLAALVPKPERLSTRWTAVLAWSGLRGGLSMVLALSLPAAIPQRDMIVTLTFGVVILSIVLQGMTVSVLLRRLGIVRSDDVRATFELARGEAMAARAALEELEHMTTVHVTPPEVQKTLTNEYTERMSAAEQRLRELPAQVESLPVEELHRVRRHLLNVEKEHVLDAFRLGAMSETTRDRLLADIDARWTTSELGAEEHHL